MEIIVIVSSILAALYLLRDLIALRLDYHFLIKDLKANIKENITDTKMKISVLEKSLVILNEIKEETLSQLNPTFSGNTGFNKKHLSWLQKKLQKNPNQMQIFKELKNANL
jgi:hypothetical protein